MSEQDMVRMTATEVGAFKAAMENTFGACQCNGSVWPKRTCPGHMFLEEDDRHVRRVDRLLYVRRTLDMWQAEEWTGKCKECGRDVQHSVGATVCRECDYAADLVEPAAPIRLPW